MNGKVLRSEEVIAKGESLSKARMTRDLPFVSFVRSGYVSAKMLKVSLNCPGSLAGSVLRHNSPNGGVL